MADGKSVVAESTFAIAGMTCEGCRAKVTAALETVAENVEVTREPPLARLRGAKPVSLEAVQGALKAGGKYTASVVPAAAAARLESVAEAAPEAASWFKTYYPLLLIGGYVAVAALAGNGLAGWMTNFMAGFFLVFSAFKFLDLRGFADSYATYDLLAQRWRGYGFVYPFLELSLGLGFLFRIAPAANNLATVALMGFSSLGVIAALRQNRKIRCACLGTVLNLPMSTVTLVEDLLMAAMAAIALLTMRG